MEIPQLVQDQENRRGIGGAAAHAAADRKDLLERKVGAFLHSCSLLQQTRSANAHVFLAIDAREADFAVLAQSDADAVGAIHQAEHRLQLVVARMLPELAL